MLVEMLDELRGLRMPDGRALFAEARRSPSGGSGREPLSNGTPDGRAEPRESVMDLEPVPERKPTACWSCGEPLHPENVNVYVIVAGGRVCRACQEGKREVAR